MNLKDISEGRQMIKEFSNETWHSSQEMEAYKRTLKTIRYHKSTDRFDIPTTTLLFISRLNDPSIRQHFEESSRHFKTYNTFNNATVIFDTPKESKGGRLGKTPFWMLNAIELLLRIKFISSFLKPFLKEEYIDHFSFRSKLNSLTKKELAKELSVLFQLIGLKTFSKLNVLIGPKEDRGITFGIWFICKALNDSEITNLLANEGIKIPENFQAHYGLFYKVKNKLSYRTTVPVSDMNRSLMNYLEKKTKWVLERKKVKNLIDVAVKSNIKIIIIGRRLLTRGHDPLNETALIQSYDYENDLDLKYIQKILLSFLESLKQSNSEALIVVENFPNQISYLISRDEELKKFLHGKTIALACIEPETKDIYAFEGTHFVQKNLKHIY